jgi:hypothetical protein
LKLKQLVMNIWKIKGFDDLIEKPRCLSSTTKTFDINRGQMGYGRVGDSLNTKEVVPFQQAEINGETSISTWMGCHERLVSDGDIREEGPMYD